MSHTEDLLPSPLPPAVPPLTPEPPPPPAPHRRLRWLRWLRWLLLLSLLLLLGVGGALAWFTATPAGFASLWPLLERASGGQLKVGRSHGTLWHGFVLEDLRWQTPQQQLALSRLQLAWSPQRLWQRQLQIEQLHLGVLRYHSSKPSDGSPPQLPAHLRLPLDVAIDSLRLDALQLGDAPPLLNALDAGYYYQQQQHALVLRRLDSRWGRMYASVALGSSAPFALGGQLEYDGQLEGVASRGVLTLQQSLLAPRVSGTVSALGLSAQLSARLRPFAPQALQRLQQLDVRIGGINPQALQPGWPQARLGLALQLAPGAGGVLDGGVSLINYQPGALSAQRLPLSLLYGPFQIRDDTLLLNNLVAELADGRATLNGRVSASALALALRLDGIHSQALLASLPSHRIGGDIRVSGSPRAPRLALALASGKLSLRGGLALPVPQQWQLQQLQLGTGAGRLLLDGTLALGAVPQLDARGKLQALNPAAISPQLPVGNINGNFSARVRLAQAPQGELQLQLTPGTLSGAPLSGQLQASWQAQRLRTLQGQLQLGGNSLRLNGSYGQPGDRLQMLLDAPQLGLLGPAFAGRVRGELDLGGVPARPQVRADLQASNLRLPGALAVASLSLQGESGIADDSPFRIRLDGRTLTLGDRQLARLSLQADGSRLAHRLQLSADGRLQQHEQQLALQLAGGFERGSSNWRGTLQQLEGSGWLPLRLQQPVALRAGAANVALAASRWEALGAQWQLGESSWQRGGGWRSEGRVQGLALSALAPWFTPPLRQTLVFDAGWQLNGAQGWPQGSVQLQRTQGDVWLPAPAGEQALGLSRATLSVGLGERGPLALALDSRFGKLAADGSVLWGNGGSVANAALTGSVRLQVPSLALAQPWLKAGMELSGSLDATLQLGGTLSSPTLDGPLLGHDLRFIERRNGIRLEQGQLQARLAGQQLLIDSLRFGKQGELTGSGRIDLFQQTPDVLLLLDFKRFAALERPGRRLLLSGRSRVEVRQRVVTLSGNLSVDEGRIDIPKLGGPRLSDDVVVVGREVVDDAGNRWPLALDLRIALGDKLRFGGNGLEAWLGGEVRLLAEQGGTLQARGQIRVDKGRFKAYGQDLDITRGLITFSGPLDNPALDLRTTRRFSPVGAGVEVRGALLTPTVKLVADEAMSEKDKLSWLVLGRAAAVGDNTGGAGAAAGGLLAGLINDQVGLFDDIGVQSRAESTSSAGVVSPAEQVVTLGKQLTRELYVGYEYGLRSAEQALKVSYQLSRTLSLIGRAGRDASSELRYTRRFD
ncbi:translocation/assembly module TamB domain-containing protein [Vogesella indigofera]|uniref:Translocation/assembly module TamB domain-containing protein n=1 Tax=Vogesella indigofera TaxID=45465 RepID=A0ABT5I657_VOGIN|nr:translocation/assembly module TamB domain-containing protein [Vogesella indigofera]MDC7691654.1 translocation/assembly module TamB domain-containing protein [Vogesella indigofera]